MNEPRSLNGFKLRVTSDACMCSILCTTINYSSAVSSCYPCHSQAVLCQGRESWKLNAG